MKEFSGFADLEFFAEGGRYEKWITQCGQNGIPLSHLHPIPGGVSGWMPSRYYKQAQKIAKSCRTNLKIGHKRGICFKLSKWKGRRGLLFVPLIFLISVHLLGNLVWSIQWLGVEPTEQAALKQALYSMNIYEGSVLTQQKVRESEKNLLAQLPELGWLSLNFGKGRLVVEAAPVREKPEIESNDPVNLIAKADGRILSMSVEEGIREKSPGQVVAQGEVLVRAGRTDRDGRMIPTHAKGSVQAQVTKTYRYEQPLKFEQMQPVGPLQHSRSLHVGSKVFSLNRVKERPPEDASKVQRPVELCGFSLPAVVEESFWVKKVSKPVNLNEQAALERAQYACRSQLYRDFPGAKLLNEEQNEEWTEEKLIYTVVCTFTADIATKSM